MRMAPSRYPKDQGSATSRTRGSSSVTAFRKRLYRPKKRSGVRYEQRSEARAALMPTAVMRRCSENLHGTPLHHHLLRAAAGKGLGSSIAPSKFRGAVSLDITRIEIAEAALKELLDKKQKGPPIHKPARHATGNVVNLMDALKASLDADKAPAASRSFCEKKNS